ncbi:C39 family peptidase [Patescibacteria group bacterium]|nr:C39 family peptidase [Patescibacteria group bacterium]
MKKIIYILILAALVLTVFANRVKIKNAYLDFDKEPAPMAVDLSDVKLSTIIELHELPLEFNLDIPFMVQAPNGNWDLPYQEGCEEAVIIMLNYYLEEEELNRELADKEILDLVKWQEDNRGKYKDTTIAETANIVEKYYGYNTEILYNPSIEDIKQEIVKGNPVIAPFYGRALNNPNYSGEGPLYHMMVIKGYTNNKFITNDPGTKKGKDYMYDYNTIMTAMHDWNNGDVESGQKSVFIIF